MNGINVKAIVTVLIGFLAALYVIIEVLNSRAGIGQLYLYFAIAAFILGVVAPRPGMNVLAFCSIYIDVFKRLMIIGGMPTRVEVSYILSIPPLLIAGIAISLVLSLAFSRAPIGRDIIIAFIVATLFALFSMLGMLTSENTGGLSSVGSLVNQCMYSYLIFIVPVLFPNSEQLRKYLHYFFVLIIPSVFYMFWQAYFGYAGYEYDYLASGLTIEGKNLVESMAGELRCFSTFNGCGTAATIYAIFITYCFVSFRPDNLSPTTMQRIGKLLFIPLFILAAYFTISRTGWFCGLGSLFIYFMMGSKVRAKLGIICAVGSFILFVLAAPYMQESGMLGTIERTLKRVVVEITDDPRAQRAVVLGTVGDRLQGWVNLTQEPKLWQPFGFTAAGIDMKSGNSDFRWGHDALIDSLIRFGYVPLFIALVSGAYLFSLLFRYMYSLSNASMRFKMTRLCLALCFGILVGAMGNGAQFRNFPQNFYFVVWLAIPFAVYQQAMRERKSALNAQAIDADPAGYSGLVNAQRALPASR